VTAALFTLGKFLLGIYIGKGGATSAFGAAKSLVLILIWVYYSSQILLFGAEFTRAYTNHYGSRAVPADNAQPVSAESRARQGMGPASSAPAGKVPVPQPAHAGAEGR